MSKRTSVADKPAKKRRAPETEHTGSYVFCNNTNHPLFAIEVLKSAKGNYWCKCTCATRFYYDALRGQKPPGYSRDYVIEAGASIPNEGFMNPNQV